MIRNYFLTAIRTLRQNPLYTSLSVFGIALTFVFVSVTLLVVKTTMGDYIPPKYAEKTWKIESFLNERGRYAWVTKEWYEAVIPKLSTPEMILVTTNDMLEMVNVNNMTLPIFILGVSEIYFDVSRLKFIYGRPFSKQENTDNVPVTIIDKNLASMYFGKKVNPIGKYFEMYGIEYLVVGVVESSSLINTITGSGANMWIPIGTIKVLNRDVAWYSIYLTAKDKESIPAMQEEFERALYEKSKAMDVEYKIHSSQKKSLRQENLLIGEMGFGVILLILMLIPAVNILSLNVSKSYDRSEEIAIRKTFGAPLSTIFGQLFFENTLITFAGAIIGICITPPLMSLLDRMVLDISLIPMTLSLNFNWATIFFVAVPCVLLFSFLSGCIPAWITAKREITNVLKGETK